MKTYHQLTLVERECIYGMLEKGFSLRSIGKQLHRSHASISREIHRNIAYGNEYFGNPYLPCKAQELADKRMSRQRRKAPLKNPEIFLYVREHLRMRWSPETIAGRLSLDHPELSICPETIYQYIYARKIKTRGMHLEQYLTLRRRKRMKKLGRSVHRLGRIPEAVSIDKRPTIIDRRKQMGHWETDNVVGKSTDANTLSVTVERKTRFTVLTKLSDRTAHTKADAVIQRLRIFPKQARRSLTADNGRENVNHHVVTQETGMPVYFCHAYHSWEKGTVENTNGRIRRYIPKGISIDFISNTFVHALEDNLNNTPRKCLQYRTPYEMMVKLRTPTDEWCTSR
jgi:transposase, IS30 family